MSTPKSIPIDVPAFIEPNVAIDHLLNDPRTRRLMIRTVVDELAATITESYSRRAARAIVRALAEAEAAGRATAAHSRVVLVPDSPTGANQAMPVLRATES